MANCENCGAPLKPGANQCEFCGSEVTQNKSKNIDTDGINISINTPNGANSNININISTNKNSSNGASQAEFNDKFNDMFNNIFNNENSEFNKNSKFNKFNTATTQPDFNQPRGFSQQDISAPQQNISPQSNYSFPVSPKSKWLDFFLALFLGIFGIHKFYEGKIAMGILYLFTFGLFYIGWIYDLIHILLNKATDKNGLPIIK